MSQSTFLEDLSSWTSDECQAKYNTVVPKLIQAVSSTDDIQRDIDILKLLFTSFVPCIPLPELEEFCLSQIVEKVCKVFDCLLEKIPLLINSCVMKDAANDLTGSLATVIEAGIDIVSCLEGCIGCVVGATEQVELSKVQSLPGCVLHVVQASYSHCKDSGPVYGDVLVMLSDQLTNLFKKTHSLQMSLITLLDKVQLEPSCSEEEVKLICSTLYGLFGISQLACGLDVKISITVWKAISRLACQNRQYIQHHLEVDQMLTPLCTEMNTSLEYLFSQVPKVTTQDEVTTSQGEEKAFCRGIKILGFQLKVLVSLVREYVDTMSTSLSSLLALLYSIYRFSPPSLESNHYPQQYTDELSRHVTSGIQPVVSSLVSSHHFVTCVTSIDADDDKDMAFSKLMVLLLVIDELQTCPDDIRNKWIKAPSQYYAEDVPRRLLLEQLFHILDLCHVELSLPVMLPGVMCQGKPQRSVSLYEYVCTHVCAFLPAAAENSFHSVEQCLLERVLGHKPYSAILAVDLWSFIARYGSADLCRDHVHLVIKILLQTGVNPSIQCCHLVMLLRRLFSFLAADHQVELMKSHSPDLHPDLYSVLPFSCLQPAAAQEVLDQLVVTCTKTIHTWLNKSKLTGKDLLCTITCLESLVNAFSNSSQVLQYVTSQHQSALLIKLLQMWDYLQDISDELLTENYITEKLPISLLKLTMFLIDRLDNSQMCQVLEKCKPFVEKGCDEFRLVVCKFLSQMSAKQFVANSEQAACLQYLSDLYSNLLCDGKPAVYQAALTAFCQFAEKTPHEKMVAACLQATPEAQDRVVSYLSKNSIEDTPTVDKCESLQVEQELFSAPISACEKNIFTPATFKESLSNVEPSFKKPRLSEFKNTEQEQNDQSSKITVSLSELSKHADTLKQCCGDKGLPEQYRVELQAVVEKLCQISDLSS